MSKTLDCELMNETTRKIIHVLDDIFAQLILFQQKIQ